jgi:hypothetical protein
MIGRSSERIHYLVRADDRLVWLSLILLVCMTNLVAARLAVKLPCSNASRRVAHCRRGRIRATARG